VRRKTEFKQVYQFKITLRGIRPPIWRRIQVPEIYTFWDLHVAIQDAMGWTDTHLHMFRMADPQTGLETTIEIPDEDFDSITEPLFGREERIADWFSLENRSADYVYDFGDNWVHKVELEKILPKEEGVNYPRCIAGRRACPPEDCGGDYGYERLLEIISDPDNDEYDEMMEWLGGEFDPEHFDPEEIFFDDPEERWKFAYE